MTLHIGLSEYTVNIVDHLPEGAFVCADAATRSIRVTRAARIADLLAACEALVPVEFPRAKALPLVPLAS